MGPYKTTSFDFGGNYKFLKSDLHLSSSSPILISQSHTQPSSPSHTLMAPHIAGDRASPEQHLDTADRTSPKSRVHARHHRLVQIGNLGLLLLWHILQIIVRTWYSISVVGNLFESYFISCGVLKKYQSLHLGKVRYLAIVIESEEAYQISKVIKLLQWLDSIGVRNVCLYDMKGVLKRSKETIFQKLKNAKSIEEVNEVVTHHAPDHMTLEFLSYVDGKEAVAKAANLIFVENLKQHNLGREKILLETQFNEALQIVGSKGPEPDLLLVYGPVRSHLGFPAWRIRYTEIIHMGSLNLMRYGALIKAMYNFTKVHQNYGS